MSWLAVGLGAAIGAWSRWCLGMWMNNIHQHIPLGTLVANLVGGFIIGMATSFFFWHNNLSPECRLFIITGFLGGLTTFSTFSAETVLMLQRGEYIWASVQILLHVAGSILMCIAGFAAYRYLSTL